MFDTPDPSPGCILLIALVVSLIAIHRFSRTIFRKRRGKEEIAAFVTLFSLPILCTLAGALLDSVFRDPPTPLFKPSNSDIVGTWHLTHDSVEYLQSEGYTVAAYQLVFKDDGTFYMEHLPGRWRYWDKSPEARYITGSGTWRIGKLQYWTVFAKIQTMNAQTRSNEYIDFWVEGIVPPYTFAINLGSMIGSLNFQKD